MCCLACLGLRLARRARCGAHTSRRAGRAAPRRSKREVLAEIGTLGVATNVPQRHTKRASARNEKNISRERPGSQESPRANNSTQRGLSDSAS